MPALFRVAFERAVGGLSGADLALLQRTPPGEIEALGWMSDSDYSALGPLLDTLAQREARFRYHLRRPERDRLEAALGSAVFQDPRRMFLLAFGIDDRFATFVEDAPSGAASSGVISAPATFFEDIQNAPPPIGQMTPMAICRRWFRRFWVIDPTPKLVAFGTVPKPSARRAPARSIQSLQRACDDEELKLALVAWRRHSHEDLRRAADASPGCFAIEGLNRVGRSGLLDDVVEQLADARAHIALLPEIALDSTELAALQESLRRRAGRYPALVVAGLAHVKAEDGGSYVNEAVALDARGDEVLRHEKLEPYTSPTDGLEDIVPRQSVVYGYLDTPVGRLVLNICRDFRSDVPLLLNRMLGASLIMVPTYSNRLDFAHEEARVLGARQRAIVAAVNPLCDALQDSMLVYAPIRGSGGIARRSQDELASLLGPAGDVVVQVVRLRHLPSRIAALDADLPRLV